MGSREIPRIAGGAAGKSPGENGPARRHRKMGNADPSGAHQEMAGGTMSWANLSYRSLDYAL